MRTEKLVTGQVYHICNRSTEGIPIFRQKGDAVRFLETLLLSNTTDMMTMRGVARTPGQYRNRRKSKPLVEIYALVLMPNHFHICARQLVENGISLWIQRVCNSHARFYNLKNARRGALFMGRFNAVLVEKDEQLFHLFVYLHANPLDLVMPEWREGNLRAWQKADKYLRTYPWSSHNLLIGKGDVHPIIRKLISPRFSKKIISSWGGLSQGIREWSQRDYEESKKLFLE